MRFGEWDFVNASITNIFSMPAFWLMYRSRDAKIKYESTSSTIGHTISTGWNPCHGIRPLRGYHPPPPHPHLALTDENVLKSYEAATAQICWFFCVFFLTYIRHLPELKLMPTTSVNFFLLIFVDKTVEVERAIYEGWERDRRRGMLFAFCSCCHSATAATLLPLSRTTDATF